MSSGVTRKVNPGLSRELNEPRRDPGSFEDIPRITKVAADATAPRAKDLVVIITGANSPLGIGRATAHQFAAAGAHAIYLCDINDSHLETHKREVAALYPATTVHTEAFDACDEAAVKAVCDAAVRSYGRLDVMFANAGIASGLSFDALDANDFMRVVRGNLLATFLCARFAARAMHATSATVKPFPRGSIVLTASVAGLRSNAGDSAYSAAKAGIVSLAQTMAYQLAGTGIRVNAVCPGIIETGMTAPVYAMARQKGTEGKIGQLNPLRRGGLPDEVARAVLFLGTEESSYVNGQAWAVDGGLSVGHPFVPGKLA